MVYTFMLHALFCVTQFNFFLLTLDVSIFEKRLILCMGVIGEQSF